MSTARHPAQARRWLVPLLVSLAFLGAGLLARPAVNPVNDSYRYARIELALLGQSPERARQEALAGYCAAQARWEARRGTLFPATMDRPARLAERTRGCVARYPEGLTPNSARYEAIFDGRIGYPLLAVPLVKLLGLYPGLSATSVLCTALGGLLIFLLLRRLGLSVGLAAAGQVLYLASPIGWWGAYPLTEGTALALTAAALLGSCWLLHRRTATGAALLTGALALGVAVRYSTFLLLAAGLAAAALLALVTTRRVRHAGTWTLVGIAGFAAAGTVALTRLLRLPGAGETLQDTFTEHFTRPDVADPWQRLVQLNLNFWPSWLQQELRAPWLLLGLALGGWALFRRDVALGWLTLAAAGTGFAAQLAHPVSSQDDRLYIAAWLVPVVGLPLLLDRLRAPATAAGLPAREPAAAGEPARELAAAGEPASVR